MFFENSNCRDCAVVAHIIAEEDITVVTVNQPPRDPNVRTYLSLILYIIHYMHIIFRVLVCGIYSLWDIFLASPGMHSHILARGVLGCLIR